MSTTPRDIVAAAMRMIGVLASGETAEAAAQADAISALNRMVSSWSLESLLCIAKVREVFTFVPGTGAYTMGTGDTFNTTRPIDIEFALCQIAGTSPLLELPIEKITLAEYAAIAVKSLQSPIPTHLYIEGTNPLETLNFWPVPSVANVFVAYSTKPILDAISNASTSIDLPPGWDDAIITNLAVKLCPEYGKAASMELMTQAMESKATIQRQNVKPLYAACDAGAMGGSGRRSFNILAGDK